MTIKNANSFPELFIGMHMIPGAAQYDPPGADSYKVFLNEKTVKEMDASFRGKPVYVGHIDEVNVRDIEKADGYVVESFYEPCDGRHYVRFLVVSDKAKDAIKQGWQLSNAYIPKTFGPPGMWNGIPYEKEITAGEYEHLAIVPDPRYAESKIFTPEKFAEYVKNKELELARVANSLNEGEPQMAFWKKQKLENALEFESTMVDLPKSKTQVDLKTLVNEMDDYRLKMDLPKMANDDDMVDFGEGKKMNVKELKDCYNSMMAEKMEMEKKKNEDEEEEKKKNDAESEERDAVSEEKKKEMKGNEGIEAKDKAKNADEDDKEAKKMNAQKLFNELNNAHLIPFKEERQPDLSYERVARGKARYGSN
jgi:hypothetical protein